METLTLRVQKSPFGLLRVSVLETGQVACLPYEPLEGAAGQAELPPGATVAEFGATAVHAAYYRDRADEVVELQPVRRPPAAAGALPGAA
jgi:hypothetical protein